MTNLFKWGARKTAAPAPPQEAQPAKAGVRATSKVLPKFLAALAHRSAPVLLDLGPVVGSNISFFGDRLACKIHVEDLYSDVEAFAKRGESKTLARALATRLTQPDESVDGILCWDLFDFLDRPASQALGSRLVRILRPGGVIYGFFGTTPEDLTHYTRFVVEGEHTLRLRAYAATPTRRNVLLTRDINKMLQGLAAAESVLLKSRSREMLFRKP